MVAILAGQPDWLLIGCCLETAEANDWLDVSSQSARGVTSADLWRCLVGGATCHVWPWRSPCEDNKLDRFGTCHIFLLRVHRFLPVNSIRLFVA